jgi:hypothetical protein
MSKWSIKRFHDILYKNGTAFDENEIIFIRNLTLSS